MIIRYIDMINLVNLTHMSKVFVMWGSMTRFSFLAKYDHSAYIFKITVN